MALMKSFSPLMAKTNFRFNVDCQLGSGQVKISLDKIFIYPDARIYWTLRTRRAGYCGGNATGQNGRVSYSIGQVDFITVSGSGGTVTQGIQQPYEIFVVGVEDNQDIRLEVEATAMSIGYDFRGVDRSGVENGGHYGLRYAEFVVPLVKALQEQREGKKNSPAKSLTGLRFMKIIFFAVM